MPFFAMPAAGSWCRAVVLQEEGSFLQLQPCITAPHEGKDVEGRSVPSLPGGTLGDKILCTLHSCGHSTLSTFLLSVHF